MKILKKHVARRFVVEAYAAYDCQKKCVPSPRLSDSDWSSADAIDRALEVATLKIGIAAGYLFWDRVEITLEDLIDCAVDASIFPGHSRKLGSVPHDQLTKCRPGKWYESIAQGRPLGENVPMLLRPAVRSESPAKWYIEDGSGRAITFLANRELFHPSQALAIGYLGRTPDQHSTFMQQKFQELLLSERAQTAE
jgi:hypothetical protein